MILGVVSLVVLALVVFMTINVTVSVQQKIRLQNYADAKAFSLAVIEARSLNYFAYTNRAIASSYVSMANLHAYMSEATMLTDLRLSSAAVMTEIAAQELAQCFCWPGVPCRPQHCYHSFEAEMNALGLTIDALSGKVAKKIQNVDRSAQSVMSALNLHIGALHASQQAVKAGVLIALGKGEFGDLKADNMSKAASVTSDPLTLSIQNVQQWNQVFESNEQRKRRIMAETVNATRQDFAWNRKGAPLANGLLFPQLGKLVKSESIWMGPEGTWLSVQAPGGVSGRTGVTASGSFPGQSGAMAILTRDVASNIEGKSMSTYDHSALTGTWRHGAGGALLPLLGPIGVARLSSGDSEAHKSGLFSLTGNPHSGSAHSSPKLDMHRFLEFNIGDSYPYNQPAVYATATTDGRVNEFGNRGPYEIAKDGTGTVRITKVGPTDGVLTLTNNSPTKAFSKAQVYYHRIGDWSDYPNIFNPYWRAKLHPMTTRELATTLTIVDSNAAILVGGAQAVPGGGGKGVNIQ
ncbi:hypothetical protein [Melittangium boletus]|uniref:Uncharacterized protein n=1 Tax=Melittangium boletus DSM 14713 TaxID=1294270 RepID=A0A250IDZ9_9BACT|nr:hypothetical protein [Melittangium boletus]ATB29463.1 hypothetical protein MEBOL_002913 [Melittangium boletus DSM 14713]